MSKTLFWYIFWDLLRIFGMASGALAGIMSFGGLLRPLTQAGLTGRELGKLMTYLMPAMSAYSLPVAALFAATVVYGRMAADNELTACRACGISFITMTLPAVLLGVVVSIYSLVFLSFIVPSAAMKIEKIITSNYARLIVHEITRSHETKFDLKYSVFAQDAWLPPADLARPDRQVVVLQGPLFASYISPGLPDKYFRYPKDFYTATQAVLYIDQAVDGQQQISATLTNGVRFPREFSGPRSSQMGVEATQVGPFTMPSPLGEKTKFLDIFRLKALEKDPAQAQSVQKILAGYVRRDQEVAFFDWLTAELSGPAGRCLLGSGDDSYVLTRGDAEVKRNHAMLSDDVALTVGSLPAQRPISFRQEHLGQPVMTAEAHRLRILAVADPVNAQFVVTAELADTVIDVGDVPTPRAALPPRSFTVPMSASVAAMRDRSADYYLNHANLDRATQQPLLKAYVSTVNHVWGEIHSRMAFAVSCLVLVMVGAALGMMFRSGNFLTAFAVSVIPAILTIVLIVTGQHTAENVPDAITAATNPLTAGLTMIWTGNATVAVAGAVLMVRLQKQ